TVIFSEGSLISFLQEAGFRNIQVWAGHNPAQAAISLASVINIDEPRFRSMWLLPLAIIINIVESIFNNSGVLRFKAQKTV
ncbi:MAG: hypothetical protein R3321_11205, partial [Nitrososphaeraceae archaeon]|nr:hypothetical protein [Nitrososphaeraceae archaeon]